MAKTLSNQPKVMKINLFSQWLETRVSEIANKIIREPTLSQEDTIVMALSEQMKILKQQTAELTTK